MWELGAPWVPQVQPGSQAGTAGQQAQSRSPHLTGSWQQVQLDVRVCQPIVVHRLQALGRGEQQRV